MGSGRDGRHRSLQAYIPEPSGEPVVLADGILQGDGGGLDVVDRGVGGVGTSVQHVADTVVDRGPLGVNVLVTGLARSDSCHLGDESGFREPSCGGVVVLGCIGEVDSRFDIVGGGVVVGRTLCVVVGDGVLMYLPLGIEVGSTVPDPLAVSIGVAGDAGDQGTVGSDDLGSAAGRGVVSGQVVSGPGDVDYEEDVGVVGYGSASVARSSVLLEGEVVVLGYPLRIQGEGGGLGGPLAVNDVTVGVLHQGSVGDDDYHSSGGLCGVSCEIVAGPGNSVEVGDAGIVGGGGIPVRISAVLVDGDIGGVRGPLRIDGDSGLIELPQSSDKVALGIQHRASVGIDDLHAALCRGPVSGQGVSGP